MTQQGLQEVAAFDTQDGVYDCAWSEVITVQCCKQMSLCENRKFSWQLNEDSRNWRCMQNMSLIAHNQGL